MNERDILCLIEKDDWMMRMLRTAEQLNFPDWAIGAGFVRNKVWDYLHGYTKEEVDTNDIDLVYYDPRGNDQNADEALSKSLGRETGRKWEIVNQAYAHAWNHLPPYTSLENALSQWPETATGIGVRIQKNGLFLIAPHGVHDLVNLIVRPSPLYRGGDEKVKERARTKRWLEKWPKLQFDFSTHG